METNENHITYEKTGRYFTFGNPEKAQHILFALHGYGQLASFFIKKFHAFDPDKYYIVCPEGAHRFYRSGTSGRVGASWMTKEDRLSDIADYIGFLDRVFESIRTKYSFEKRTLMGFSQGGATASRWIGYGHSNFDIFILWAAVFPPDMEPGARQKFNSQKNHFVIGTKDEYTTLDKAAAYHKLLNSDKMQFEFTKFEGNHVVDAELLQTLIK